MQVLQEIRVLYQTAIGTVGTIGQEIEAVAPGIGQAGDGVRHGNGCQQRGGSDRIEIAQGDRRQSKFLVDHFALLGQAQAATHRAGRLAEDRSIGRTASASNRTASSMKQLQPDLLLKPHLL